MPKTTEDLDWEYEKQGGTLWLLTLLLLVLFAECWAIAAINVTDWFDEFRAKFRRN